MVLERVDASHVASGAQTVAMPCSVAGDLGPDFRGRVEYQRFFNTPTGIDSSTELRLEMENAIGSEMLVILNDLKLGAIQNADGAYSFSIDGMLRGQNDLRVSLGTFPHSSSVGLVGVVQLEIG